jgi:AhpC/TSA family
MNLLVYGDFRQCETLEAGTDWRPEEALEPLNVTNASRGVSYYSRRRFMMRKKLPNVLAASLLAGALAVAGASPAVAQTKVAEGGSMSMPKVGDVAPDFTLKYFDGNELKSVSLSEYRGKKNVVLGFFIFAFTGG